jgi:hypothetical protein
MFESTENKKYNVYRPELSKVFLDLSKLGKNITQIAAELRVTTRTLDMWANDETKPEFKEAYELGRLYREAFWMKKGEDNLTNPAFKEGLFKFLTGIYFKWSEKTEQTVKDERAPASDAELDARIKQLEEKVKSNVGSTN